MNHWGTTPAALSAPTPAVYTAQTPGASMAGYDRSQGSDTGM